MAAQRPTCLLLVLLLVLFTAGLITPEAAQVDVASETIINGLRSNVQDGTSAKISGSCQVGDKCGNKVKEMKKKKGVGHFGEEVNESGFVAFNADYHAPRHHPPKNN